MLNHKLFKSLSALRNTVLSLFIFVKDRHRIVSQVDHGYFRTGIFSSLRRTFNHGLVVRVSPGTA